MPESLLVNYMEFANVGHVIEALRYTLGYHAADPSRELGVAAPVQLTLGSAARSCTASIRSSNSRLRARRCAIGREGTTPVKADDPRNGDFRSTRPAVGWPSGPVQRHCLSPRVAVRAPRRPHCDERDPTPACPSRDQPMAQVAPTLTLYVKPAVL